MKKCVLVLGMHRSGTSAMTGILEKLGYDLGGELLPNASDNTKGFFENVRVKEYNDILLDNNKSRYDDTRYAVTVKKEKTAAYAKKAAKILKEDFTSGSDIAIKDPRLCLTFPVWAEALKKTGTEIKIILIYRNPLEVAESLKKRNGFSLEKSLHLWSKYFFHSELQSRGYDRIFISFDRLIDNMEESLKEISSFLGIGDTDEKKLNGFIDKGLKHNNIDYKTFGKDIPEHTVEILQIMEADRFADLKEEDFDRLREKFISYSESCVHEKPKTIKLSKRIKMAVRGH